MLATTYKVGQEVSREGVNWLVVRLIEKDTSLVVNDQGSESIVSECYAMLKNEQGEIEFEVFLHEEIPFNHSNAARTIKALPNLFKRRKA